MAINGVLRPGFMQIRVMEMEKALWHYRDILGLDVVGTGEDGRVYLKAYDEFHAKGARTLYQHKSQQEGGTPAAQSKEGQ